MKFNIESQMLDLNIKFFSLVILIIYLVYVLIYDVKKHISNIFHNVIYDIKCTNICKNRKGEMKIRMLKEKKLKYHLRN